MGLAWVWLASVELRWVRLGWVGLGCFGPYLRQWRLFQTDLIPGQQAGPGANGLVPVLEVVFVPASASAAMWRARLGLGEVRLGWLGWVG